MAIVRAADVGPAHKPPRLWRAYARCYDGVVLSLRPYIVLRGRIVEALSHQLGGLAAPTIVELCCGTGNVLEAIQARWPQARLTGVDFSEHMLGRAARKVPRARLVLGRLPESLGGLADGQADAIVVCNGLYPLDDARGAIRHIGRLLRPGGVAVLTDPQAGAKLRRLAIEHFRQGGWKTLHRLGWLMLGSLFALLLRRNPRQPFLSAAAVVEMLTETGLTVESQSVAYSGANYFLVVRRD